MVSIDEYRDRFPNLRFECEVDGVLELVLASKNRNAIDVHMHYDLAHVWSAIDHDPDTLVVLLRGADGTFSAGGDFSLIHGVAENAAERARLLRETLDLVYNYINCNKPTISAVQGHAVGAGLVMAVLADISVVADDAVLLDPHTRIGVPAGDHAAMIWPILCGMAKAKYYLFTCEEIRGRDADDMSLVSKSVPDDDVLPEARRIAERLLGMSHYSLQWTKYAMNNWLRSAGPIFDTSLALEIAGFANREIIEGTTAIKERREPRYDDPRMSEALAARRPTPRPDSD